MKKRLGFSIAFALLVPGFARGAGLPKESLQILVKSLQDPNVDVRTAAAQALADLGDSAETAVRPMENALIASADPKEQEALTAGLVGLGDKNTAKRLSDALSNPQFTWGSGAKVKAVGVIGKVGDRKMLKWLTDLASGDGEPSVRAAALQALGRIGAPPKKEDKK